MKTYQSHKQVQAKPMMRFEAQSLGLVRDEKPIDEPGYHVVYSHDYESWSPKASFEEGYTELSASATKTLGNTCANGATKNVKDIVFWGDGDMFKLISKASSESEGWMKSTKAMDVGTGCVVQVTTQQRNTDLTYSIAEALTYVPGVKIVEYTSEDNSAITSRRLEPIIHE